MFSRHLFNGDPRQATAVLDPAAPDFRMGDFGYGKKRVRVFQLKKDGPVHAITEFKVNSHLRLNSHKEYYNGDNSEIVGSDVQETSIYVHAQKFGLTTPEEFALSITQHFLNTYDAVMESNIYVEDEGWERFGRHETHGRYRGTEHNHAFTRGANGKRFCEVVRKRKDPKPMLIGGLSGLRVIKTARSPFVGYHKGTLFTEGDMPDRTLCVEIHARWEYSRLENIDFTSHWHRVREVMLFSILGDPVEGVQTTSVQNMAYVAECAVLKNVPEINSISISLLNFPHLPFDFSRFPLTDMKRADVIIANPAEEPANIGYAQLDRVHHKL